MRPVKKSSFPVYLYLLIILAAACNFTATYSKPPALKAEMGNLEKELDSLVACEDFILEGEVININGKRSTELTIRIINGKELLFDYTQMNTLAKSIAHCVKKALKDEKDYNKYMVVFVAREPGGNATKERSVAYTFAAADLEVKNYLSL